MPKIKEVEIKPGEGSLFVPPEGTASGGTVDSTDYRDTSGTGSLTTNSGYSADKISVQARNLGVGFPIYVGTNGDPNFVLDLKTIKAGNGVHIEADTESISISTVAEFRIASAAFAGSIRVGDGLVIDGDGILSTILPSQASGTEGAIQFNHDGMFGSSASLSWDDANGVLVTSKISGDGSLLSNLDASSLTSGTVNQERLGTGVYDDNTFLRGDGAWVAVLPPGMDSSSTFVTSVAGKVGAVVLSTTDVPEGANFYYTTTRFSSDFDQRFLTKNLIDLFDVDDNVASAVYGDTLTWDGTTWSAMPIPASPVTSVNSLIGDVLLTTSDIVEGSRPYYSKFRFDSDFESKMIEDLNNVFTLDPVQNEVLTYFGGRWVNKPVVLPTTNTGKLAISLRNLEDVQLPEIVPDRSFLVFDSTENAWVSYSIPEVDTVSSVNGKTGAVVLTTDDIGEGATNFWFTQARFDTALDVKLATVKLQDLADTNVAVPEVGDILVWDDINQVWAAGPSPSAPVLSVNGKIGTVDLLTTDITEPNTYNDDTKILFTGTRVKTIIAGTKMDDLNDVTITDAAPGQYLVFQGTQWVNSSIVQGAAGATTQLQVNNGGAFAGFTSLTWDDAAKTFRAGLVRITNGGGAFGPTYSGIENWSGNLGFVAGTGELATATRFGMERDLARLEMASKDGGDGGSIEFIARDGTTTSTAGHAGGNVSITIGRSVNGGDTGNFIVKTLANERFKVEADDGIIHVNGTPGTPGQVLTSGGSSSAPSWANPAPAPGGIDTQVQFNDAGAMVGSSSFTWRKLTSTLGIGSTGPAFIRQFDGGGNDNSLSIIAGAGGTFPGGKVQVIGGASGPTTEAGGVEILGGPSSISASSGKVLIAGGDTAAYQSGPGGDVEIRGGNTASGSGGFVTLTSGNSTTGVQGGVKLRTARFVSFEVGSSEYTPVFAINGDGSWSMGNPGTNRGTFGQVLTNTGPTSAPIWAEPTLTSASGIDHSIQFNNNGAIYGNSTFTYDRILSKMNVGTKLVPGIVAGSDTEDASGSLTVRGGNGAFSSGLGAPGGSLNLFGGAAAGNGAGGGVIIKGGKSGSVSATGNVTISGADPSDGSDASGGSVTISGGSSKGSGSSGDVMLKTYGSGTGGGGDVAIYTSSTASTIERLRIRNNGSWSVGSTGVATGTAGQLLMSTGSSTPPVWSSDASGLTSLSAGSVTSGVFTTDRLGTGTGTTLTFLRGDGTWAVPPLTAGGAAGQVQYNSGGILTGSSTLTFSGGTLSATTFSGSGSGLTSLNASNLSTGTVPVARLGSSGTASSATYLRGDNTWVSPPYDLALTIVGKPTASAYVLTFAVVNGFTLPAGLTGSVAKASIASAGTATFTIHKNGTPVGTVAFSASVTGTFSFSTQQTFASGDILQITAPSTQDANLANIGITLKATMV